MKILIAYYSRTGVTKKIALKLAEFLVCETEEIKTKNNRLGIIGYLISGKEAYFKKPAKIEETKSDPSLYNLVIVGTPIWSFNLSSPIRAYLKKYQGKIKQIAFFCTQGGRGAEQAFLEMKKESGIKPTATLTLKTKEVVNEQYLEQLNNFIKQIKS